MSEKTHKLVLQNDSVNDYMFVIACLIRVCNHEREQAEQCAIITHNNRKCDIKSGVFTEMFDMKSQLEELGLNIELEAIEGCLH